MAEAPTGDGILTEKDASRVLEELISAQTESYVLGLRLGLPPHDVDAIYTEHKKPRDRLLHVIIAFLRQTNRPTWRMIIEALRNHVVNLSALASTVEAAHFPDPTATRPPPTAVAGKSGVSVSRELVPGNRQPSSDITALVLAETSEQVKMMIRELEMEFNTLKSKIREHLESHKILVAKIIDVLTSLSPDDDDRHKLFLESHVNDLACAANHSVLFGTMNFHWNYHDPSLLERLVRDLALHEFKDQIEAYNSNLQQFRKKTPLNLYRRAQKRKRTRLTPDFHEVVAEIELPDPVTMDDAEQFRQDYASHYGLHDFAMMLAQVQEGSFIITWFIPQSIVEKLKKNVPRATLKKYSVTRLEVAGVCLYRARKPIEVSSRAGPGKSGPDNGDPDSAASIQKTIRPTNQPNELPEEDYLFVEQPSEDFYCPVTMGLLFQPHLTSCCGNHLSQEAATRIQREGGVCPLCKEKKWNTVLNKRFQRQVKSLRVFCRYEERGCGWQGVLTDLKRHVSICPMKEGQLMTELVKLSLYSGEVNAPSESHKYQQTANRDTSHPQKTVRTPQTAAAAAAGGGRDISKMKWKKGKIAPEAMKRGAAVVHGNTAYFKPADSVKVYSYQNIQGEEQWYRLPDNHNENCGLAIIDGLLTSVGGYKNYKFTNILLSVRREGKRKKWSEIFPPMPTPRRHVACVTAGETLVVAGGDLEWNPLNTVEVMNTDTKLWATVSPLPGKCAKFSATVCGDNLYLAGGENISRDATDVVFTCSLPDLLKPTKLASNVSTHHNVWREIKRLRIIRSTLVSFDGDLLAIGGTYNSSLYRYDSHTNCWTLASHITDRRSECFAVTLTEGRLIVVGGLDDKHVQQCTVLKLV